MLIKLLLLTIILECIALYFLGERNPRFYFYWIALTSLTNILVNLYIMYVFSGTYLEYSIAVAIIEILVFIAEGCLCYIYTNDKAKSIKYSAVCNASSFLTGLFIQLLF